MALHAGRIIAALFVAFFIGLPLDAFAQSQVPTTAEPGIISRSFEKQDPLPSRDRDIVVLPTDTRDDGKGLSTEKVFVLQRVVLEGSTIYTQEDAKRIAADYIGQKVSFADLHAIAQAVTKQYRDDGYIFSRAVLAPQKIKDGVVTLKIIEGRVTDVKIIGEYRDENDLIKDMAAKIKTAGPTNESDIERYLLLINDLPGITARSVLQPSSIPGGGQLLITIEEEMFEGSVGIDNRGSRYLGPFRGTGIVAANSVVGIHERTTVRGIISSDTTALRFADIIHEQQIGTDGFKVKGRFARTETRPNDGLLGFDIKGDSNMFDLEGLYPILRGRRQNFNLSGGFNVLNSSSEVTGLQVAEDRVRTIRALGHYDFTDSWAGINQAELQFTQGLKGFDATPDGLGRSRANGRANFTRTNFSATRVQDLWSGFSAQLSITGQYSDVPLLSSEEFAIGGSDYGRAYDVGEITGDSGFAGALELRYSGPSPTEYIPSYQLFAYYDGGKVWNKNLVVGENATDSLTSVGVGARFNLMYDVSGSLEVNKPISRTVAAEGGRDPRVFFTLLKRF